MNIRKATKTDKNILIEFLQAMLVEISKTGGDSISEDNLLFPWLNGRIENGLNNPNILYLMAESDSGTGSFLGFGEASIKNITIPYQEKKIVHIHAIYIKPEYRKQGIGKRLIEEIMKWGRENHCSEIELGVLFNNSAQSLYQNLGFQITKLEMRRPL